MYLVMSAQNSTAAINNNKTSYFSFSHMANFSVIYIQKQGKEILHCYLKLILCQRQKSGVKKQCKITTDKSIQHKPEYSFSTFHLSSS